MACRTYLEAQKASVSLGEVAEDNLQIRLLRLISSGGMQYEPDFCFVLQAILRSISSSWCTMLK